MGFGGFLISQQNIRCDSSLELSQRDSSNQGYNIRFHGKLTKNVIFIIPITPSDLEGRAGIFCLSVADVTS